MESVAQAPGAIDLLLSSVTAQATPAIQCGITNGIASNEAKEIVVRYAGCA